MVRVVVADDHALCRLGLARLIGEQPDLELAATAESAAEALDRVEADRPDVLVTAVSLSGGNGLELTRRLRGAERLGVVVLGDSEAEDTLFQAMEAGASAFVTASAPVAQMVAAIRHAAVAPGSFTADGLVEALERRRRDRELLTPRERETLHLLMQGLPIAEIGHYMNLSPHTAKTYTARIYDKLGVTNRTQAVMTALRMGLVSAGAGGAGTAACRAARHR
ncbi:response regulator transcription factor [Actinocorallia populi]|uniref:response regulator transcription factor n=1 Tax=Actinocorallia populi TaxID=2079200 RepID=UPI001E5235A7|nr:response regulator transcription factor [Actinocorallia populi]